MLDSCTGDFAHSSFPLITHFQNGLIYDVKQGLVKAFYTDHGI